MGRLQLEGTEFHLADTKRGDLAEVERAIANATNATKDYGREALNGYHPAAQIGDDEYTLLIFAGTSGPAWYLLIHMANVLSFFGVSFGVFLSF
jgi:hypothetical protein